MENASRALLMAGGVLISVILISVAVLAFQNIREYKSNEELEKLKKQEEKFNKQYDIYNNNDLYGTDVLYTLVNKVYDYNKRECNETGYSVMDITVTFKSNISSFEKNKTYTANQLRTALASLEKNINNIQNKVYCGKTIKQLASMRTAEIENLFTINNKLNKLQEAQSYVTEYTNNKAQELTLKTMKFKCTNVGYDKVTGRINLMQFIEM